MLASIQSPADIKGLSTAELDALAAEIREELISVVSRNGGHLASNLGVVELTLALHKVFDAPKDKILFDVGHQSYVHKMLTGRADALCTIRTKDGLSGFPKRAESRYDVFDTGHSSTSLSAALGVLRAARLQGSGEYVVAVIGDGALTGGLAFEALNDAGQSELPLIVVLNDNGMSISRNVGALTRHLNALRSSPGYQRFKSRLEALLERLPEGGERVSLRLGNLKDRIKYFLLPNVLFEEMGFKYWGPVDGHDIQRLCEALQRAKALRRPVIIHAITHKGKGYAPAESSPEKFHGVGAFDAATGATPPAGQCNSAAVGEAVCAAAAEDPAVVVVCAAMAAGTGMRAFSQAFPQRFFDVGIAEAHAVTMAAGMAVRGLRPVVTVYSSFLQRAYDQLLHDVCLQNLPVLVAVDRAGIVGEDGETHQGVYDIAFFLSMPRIQVWSPSTRAELKAMVRLALMQQGPVALRYNRGSLPAGEDAAVEVGKWEVLRPLRPLTVLATGRMVEPAATACAGLDVGLVNARFIRPMDEAVLGAVLDCAQTIVTVEDGVADGGFGTRIAQLAGERARVIRLGVGAEPVRHGTCAQQDEMCGLRAVDIRRTLCAHGGREVG